VHIACYESCRLHDHSSLKNLIGFIYYWYSIVYGECMRIGMVAASWLAILKINSTKGNNMLGWSVTFFIVALIAGALGFSGIAGSAAGIAQILFVVFLALLVISLIARVVRGRSV
jgi:uncharacterized membrane protein YtjA (UPF0391 family)